MLMIVHAAHEQENIFRTLCLSLHTVSESKLLLLSDQTLAVWGQLSLGIVFLYVKQKSYAL